MSTTAQPARVQRLAGRSVVVLAGSAAALFAITTFIHRYELVDLAAQHAAVRSWAGGGSLYAYRSADSGLGTTLPPVAALGLAPLAFLPLWTVGVLLGAVGVGSLVLALIALVGPVARRYRRRHWPAVFAAAALALTLEPVRAAIGRGDLDLLAFGLITADVVALRRGAWARSRAAWWPGPPVPARAGPVRRGWATGAWAGAGTGLATALTVGPVLLLGYFAVTRQWRAALTGLATVCALLGIAVLVAPREVAAWAGDVLWRLDGVDHTGNQSLAGVLARLYDSATTPLLLWFSFALLVVAVGMIRARGAHADGDEIAAFLLVGLTGAVVGPISDTHELVWVLLAILVLVDASAHSLSAFRLPLLRLPLLRLPLLRRSWSCGWPFAALRRFSSNHNSKIAAKGRRGLAYAVGAALVYLLFVTAPMESFGGPLAANAYAIGLILLLNAVPWRPGVAPAFPINRWAKRSRRPQTIPPARRPVP
ncbi:MAG TPA: glycosyltransferase 87 family protein [Actinoplanes sp.]